MHSGAIWAGASSIYHTNDAAQRVWFWRNATFSGLAGESIVTDL